LLYKGGYKLICAQVFSLLDISGAPGHLDTWSLLSGVEVAVGAVVAVGANVLVGAGVAVAVGLVGEVGVSGRWLGGVREAGPQAEANSARSRSPDARGEENLLFIFHLISDWRVRS